MFAARCGLSPAQQLTRPKGRHSVLYFPWSAFHGPLPFMVPNGNVPVIRGHNQSLLTNAA